MLTLLRQEFFKLRKGKGWWLSLLAILICNSFYLFEIKRLKDISPTVMMEQGGGGRWLIPFILIIYSSIIITNEFTNNTAKLLLARQYTRTQIFISKILTLIGLYLGLVIFNWLVDLFFRLTFLRKSHFPSHLSATSFHYLIGFSLTTLLTSTAVILISSLIKNSNSAAVSLGIVMIFASQLIGQLLAMVIDKYNWLKFNPFNFFLVAGSYQWQTTTRAMTRLGINAMTIGALIYSAIFLVLAGWIFNRRNV